MTIEQELIAADARRANDQKKTIYADLAKGDGGFNEIGTTGLEAWSGYIKMAYHTKLQWPSCEPLFSRIRRSDPEMAIVRIIFSALVRDVDFVWEPPKDPSEDDIKAAEFANEVLADIEGGIGKYRETLVSHVPFMGWGWWEIVPGLRRPDWSAPGSSKWRSQYDDGLIGIRKLGWRDHKSFHAWEMDDEIGDVTGFIQLDPPNDFETIPSSRSLHIRFGDLNNPEGLSPLEAVWRLERIKYGLEVVQGIGFEHSAGHLKITTEKDDLTAEDKSQIKAFARALLSAQQANYAAFPKGFDGEIIDSNFQAAVSILEAIRYYGLLKLQIYNTQWVALSTTSGSGSYAAMKDSSQMYIVVFNAMMEGFAKQMDDQLGTWLFKINGDAFPGMTKRPELRATPIEKLISLEELGGFWEKVMSTIDVDDEDVLAFRRKSGFLPEVIPEVEEDETEPASADTPEGDEEDLLDDADLASAAEVRSAMDRFREWTAENAPAVYKLINRKVA